MLRYLQKSLDICLKYVKMNNVKKKQTKRKAYV